jgi:hypothetical protein
MTRVRHEVVRAVVCESGDCVLRPEPIQAGFEPQASDNSSSSGPCGSRLEPHSCMGITYSEFSAEAPALAPLPLIVG